jgi:hypothetical protein
MIISTEKSDIIPFHSFKPSYHIIYTHATVEALLNSQILSQQYLIIHTFNAGTIPSACVAGGVASLLSPYSEAEELLITMQCGRHGAGVHLTAVSSLSLQD